MDNEKQETPTVTSQESKKVSTWLGIGIFLMPYFFAWVTLKKGYSQQARAFSIGWLSLFLYFNIFNKDTQTRDIASVENEQEEVRQDDCADTFNNALKYYPELKGSKPPEIISCEDLHREYEVGMRKGQMYVSKCYNFRGVTLSANPRTGNSIRIDTVNQPESKELRYKIYDRTDKVACYLLMKYSDYGLQILGVD